MHVCEKSPSISLVPGRQSEKAGAKGTRLALTSGGKRERRERVGAARGVCVVCVCVCVCV